MKVYAISNTRPNYTIKNKTATKPETVTKCLQCPPTQDVSFGSSIGHALKWTFAGCSVIAALINPALLGVICIATGAGCIASKIAEAVAMDPNEQNAVAENGKDMIDDSINDSFPY